MEDVNNEMEILWVLTHIYFDISKKKKKRKEEALRNHRFGLTAVR